MRPSTLKDVTPAASRPGSTPTAARSLVDMIRDGSCASAALAAQRVPQPARLAAAAAVAAAPADHAAQQAVAGVAVAEGAVDEGLQLETVRLERGDLGEAELARQDGAREPEARQRRQLRRTVRVQLRARVQRQIRVLLAHARGEAEVGDDEGVEAGEVRRFQRRERRLHLVVLEERVERQIRACVVQVGRLDGLRHGLAGEVAGEGARAPAREAEVHGVGAGGEGRAQRARLPRRRQKLRSGHQTAGRAGLVISRAAAGATAAAARRAPRS